MGFAKCEVLVNEIAGDNERGRDGALGDQGADVKKFDQYGQGTEAGGQGSEMSDVEAEIFRPAATCRAKNYVSLRGE